MRSIIHVPLVSLLVVQVAMAGQETGRPIPWEKTRKVTSGTEVILVVTGSQPSKVRLLFADDSMLLTLNPACQNLPAAVEQKLFRIGTKWPAILNGGQAVMEDGVRVARDGVFRGQEKVEDLADVIQQTPRETIQGIWECPHSRMPAWILPVTAYVLVLFGVLLYSGHLIGG